MTWSITASRELFLSKGIVNDKYFNPGFGLGIFTIDLINFFPIYITNSYDILPINDYLKKKSSFRLFAFNSIGYSIGTDLGFNDYLDTSGGFYFNPGIGIKKSTRNIGRINQSVNLNLKMYQIAATPSFQVIFFPSE